MYWFAYANILVSVPIENATGKIVPHEGIISISAPTSATAAYTMEFTKRVVGLGSEEKNIDFSEALVSLSFISSNASIFSSSLPNACTTFKLPTISSIKPVCSPRISEVVLNIEYVREAIYLPTNSDKGVKTNTISAIIQLRTNIKISVPRIVSTPVNS